MARIPFRAAGGSATGYEGKECIRSKNEDVFAIRHLPCGLLLLVADACGSGGNCRLGAQFAVDSLPDILRGMTVGLNASGGNTHLDKTFWRNMLSQLIRKTEEKARRLCKSHEKFIDVVRKNFMTTIFGVLITAETTYVFGIGDGFYAINGEVVEVGPFLLNAPPFYGYALFPDVPAGTVFFNVLHTQPTESVHSLLLATDGAQRLNKYPHDLIPGTNTPVGTLAQFACNTAFSAEDGAIQRWLLQLNPPPDEVEVCELLVDPSEVVSADDDTQEMIPVVYVPQSRGFFYDDTTIVVAHRVET